MIYSKNCFKMKEAKKDLLKNKNESQDIYKRLCNSVSMYNKCVKMEIVTIGVCLESTLAVLLANHISIITGSLAEGTNITSEDYDKGLQSVAPCYFSDRDYMDLMCDVWVMEEGDTLPQMFDNHICCLSERGKHTTDGFRKLRVIHRPEECSFRQYSAEDWLYIFNMSIEHGYVSSSKFLAETSTMKLDSPLKHHSIKTSHGRKGPAHIMKENGYSQDIVYCFHVKSWPKESESWFTRHTHWPDKKLKSKIRKLGYLLVPTGNRNSQESDLEWRCSFSIAEKILFQSMTTFQRYTFVMLKALLKEYLPPYINTNGEKQLLSTYHMKTLFLWSLECRNVKWEPEHMLDIIGYMLDELSGWINRQYFPHYFIPSVNLIDRRSLHDKGKSLICIVIFISAIRNDISNKIKQSQFFMGQLEGNLLGRKLICRVMPGNKLLFKFIQDCIIKEITGNVQKSMHIEVFERNKLLGNFNFSHSMLIENLISITPDVDPQKQYMYRAVYHDPIHDKLLTKVVPGLIYQYRGCIHLANYCMAARDGRVLPVVLHTAEALLKDTLHLDPCSGYVKLACLYITTEDFVHAKESLNAAENNFLYIYKNMETSAMTNLQHNGLEVDRIFTEVCTIVIHEVFKKWAEGLMNFDIIVTWPEYIFLPDLLQFELIQESTQQIIDLPYEPGPCKIVGLGCRLHWPPLSMIKLVKFVCAFNSGQSTTIHLENLVVELIASSLFVRVFPGLNDIYTVFNMAAWCYVKLNKYKQATRMMMVAIGTSSEMERCAFSHHFVAYVISQCLAKGSSFLVYKRENVWPKEKGKRVLVYKRDNVWLNETESWFTKETMSGQRKTSPGLQEREHLAKGKRKNNPGLQERQGLCKGKRRKSPGLQERQSMAKGKRKNNSGLQERKCMAKEKRKQSPCLQERQCLAKRERKKSPVSQES